MKYSFFHYINQKILNEVKIIIINVSFHSELSLDEILEEEGFLSDILTNKKKQMAE
jgi:hypothetical protein